MKGQGKGGWGGASCHQDYTRQNQLHVTCISKTLNQWKNEKRLYFTPGCLF